MADINDFSVTDGVTDNLASYHNRLLGGVLRAEFVNTETISATKELADSDCQFQVLTAATTDQVVELAPEDTTNHITIIYNSTPSTDGNSLIVKDDSGSTTYRTLGVDEWGIFLPISGEGWKPLTLNVLGTLSSSDVSFLTSSDIPIVDSGGYFTSTETEAALQEVGADLLNSVTVLEMGYIGYLSPADSTTYYSGARSAGSPATSANTRPLTIRRSGTIYAVDLIFVVDGTLASSEPFTTSLRLNNATDTTISDACQMDTAYEQFSNAALNIAISSSDTVELKMVTPAWVTNPTNTRCLALVWMRN